MDQDTSKGVLTLFLLLWYYCMWKWKYWSLSCVLLFATSRTIAHQALLCPWDSPGKNTGVGCHSLLQGILLTQGLNPGLLHCRQIVYHLSHQGIPILLPNNIQSLVSQNHKYLFHIHESAGWQPLTGSRRAGLGSKAEAGIQVCSIGLHPGTRVEEGKVALWVVLFW